MHICERNLLKEITPLLYMFRTRMIPWYCQIARWWPKLEIYALQVRTLEIYAVLCTTVHSIQYSSGAFAETLRPCEQSRIVTTSRTLHGSALCSISSTVIGVVQSAYSKTAAWPTPGLAKAWLWVPCVRLYRKLQPRRKCRGRSNKSYRNSERLHEKL